MEILYLALAAFFGAALSAFLGYFEDTDPFNGKQFGGSMIRGLIAAIGWAAAYELTGKELTVAQIIGAVFSGTTLDVAWTRGTKAYNNLKSGGSQ